MPARKAKTAARGYGWAHQRRRRLEAKRVVAGEAWCARCSVWIAPDGEPCPRCGRAGCGWDLDHVDGDRSAYLGPSHACCNRATAGRRRVSRRRW